MTSRRKFLKASQAVGLSLLASPFFTSCHQQKSINGKIAGGNSELGHRLRTMDFPAPVQSVKKDVVIVGGGIAGLSAARYLKKNKVDFSLLELESQIGGNSIGGKNDTSAFPWGAHYLPLPSNADAELISFLREVNVITGITNGLPVYNEYYLCHDPKERLFINNFWQEGIVPHEGVPKNDRDEIQRFLDAMHDFKNKIGKDGRAAFAIPLDQSSQDTEFTSLDKIPASTFLESNGYRSPYLLWYVRYCCADDFGTSIEQTSAWAMIHYFASRSGKAFNASSDTVLTWPEGNAWLANELQKSFVDNIVHNNLVYRIMLDRDKLQCYCYDAAEGVSRIIEAEKIILCTPQFVNKRLLADLPRNIDYEAFQYAPWMVANISTHHALNERRGETLCWDNVIYGSDSLGYVNAMHQQIGVYGDQKIVTYYKPLISDNASAGRQQAYRKTFQQWSNDVILDLSKAHPELEKHITEMDVWLWGHGMIKPTTGFIWSTQRQQAAQPLRSRIFFAHSDLSGISIFEEAFSQGHRAARAALTI